MRGDLKDVFVNTVRCDCEPDRGSARRWRGAIDEHPTFVSTRRAASPRNKHPDDRPSPVLRYLRSRVGKSWNKTWAAICSRADSRNVRGYHLRTHVREYVENCGGRERVSYFSACPFSVDARGILRMNRTNTYGVTR